MMTMFDPVNLHVSEVMTSDVYIIQPNATLLEARRIFDTHGFHHLPVVEEGRVVGMLSKSDVMLVSSAFPIQDPDARNEKNTALLAKLLCEEVMTRRVVKLKPDMLLGVAVGIFLENLFHALFVHPVHVGIHETDGNGFHAAFFQCLCHLPGIGFIDRGNHISGIIDAFFHLESVAPLNIRGGHILVMVPEILFCGTPYLDDIPEPL